jgi:LEA14-like dessication related protein
MRTRRLIILMLGVILIGVIFYYLLNPKKAINIILPELEQINFISADIKNDTSFTKVQLIVKNQSFFRLTIDTVYFDILLNNMEIAKEKIPLHLSEPIGKTDTINLSAKLRVKKILNTLSKLYNNDSTTLKVNCYVVYNTIFGKNKIAVDKEQKIAVPKIPKLEIVAIERKKYDLKNKTWSADLKLKIINENKKGECTLNNIRYTVKIKNTLETKGTVPGSIIIKPNSTFQFDVPITIQFEHPLKSIIGVVFNKDKLFYDLKMTYNITAKDFKNTHTIPIEIRASGDVKTAKDIFVQPDKNKSGK